MNEIVINYVYENAVLPSVIFNTASDYYKQTITVRPYGNAFQQLMFILEGEGILTFKNQNYPLKKGCAFYINSNVPISYQGTDNMIVTFLTTKGDGISQLAKHYQCEDFFYCPDIDTKKFLLDIKAIIDENFSYKRQGVMSLMSYSVFVNFFEYQKKQLDTTDKIAIYLDENFTKKISLNEIATTFGISISKLCHDFRKKFNCTVFEYILNLRLLYARNLFLTNNDAKTKEVAITCGFEDISYFCKAYKQKFGVTPSIDKKK